jgi:hypothetical protein
VLRLVDLPTLKPVKPKTIDLGAAGRAQKDTLSFDLTGIAKDDIQYMLRSIAVAETAQQIAIDNKPTLTRVDGSTTKPVLKAEKNIVIFFGTVLARAAMSLAEDALRRAIDETTTPKTGRLRSMSNWRWVLIRGGMKGMVVAIPSDLAFSFGPTDVLVLVPRSPLTYGWFVNHALAKSKRVNVEFKRARSGKRKGQLAKRYQGVGFMALAKAMIKRNPLFKDFSVYVAFSKRLGVPGDSNTYGSPCLVIRPKSRRG